MTAIIGITAQVRKLKSENKLSLKTPLATLHIFAQSQELIDAIAQHDQLIRGITQAVQTVYTSKPSPFALSLSKGNEIKEVDGLWSAWVTTE
jgi:ABC-type transporter Mla subunit MlaD